MPPKSLPPNRASRPIALLTALAAIGVLGASDRAGAFDLFLSFRHLGSQTIPSGQSLAACGIAATSDGVLQTQQNLGMGVGDTFVDDGEVVDFAFDIPALGVSYDVGAAVNGDGDGLSGEHTVEAFDASNASLGVQALSGSGVKDVSALFGDVPISHFVLTADADGIRLSRVTYAAVDGEVNTLEVPPLASGVATSMPVFPECGADVSSPDGNVLVGVAPSQIGVVDADVDPGESLEIEFVEPVRDVIYALAAGADHSFEIFGEGDVSLGTGVGTAGDNDTSLVSTTPVKTLVLTATTEPIAFGYATFVVPEPGALAAAASAIAALAARARRTKR
jgi:hypothetical protein